MAARPSGQIHKARLGFLADSLEESMAKCLINERTNEVVRVSDEEARKLVKIGWRYYAKSLWKQFRNLKRDSVNGA